MNNAIYFLIPAPAVICRGDVYVIIYKHSAFFGSSRKVRLRQRDKTNKKKEEVVIPVAIAHTFSNLDLIIETFEFSGADRKGSMGDKPINMLFF